MAETRPATPVRAYTPTALPPVGARVAAFIAIIVGGICGGLITFAVVDLQCGSDDAAARAVLPGAVPGAAATPADAGDGGCDLVAGSAGLLGAVLSAAGISVVAVLVLRAMAEWRKNLDVHEPLPDERRGGSSQRTSRSRRNPSA